jgi:restriction endonuclease Mrr
VFITTSRFTKEATEASYKKGAITILLLDGGAIAELMIERGIGVVKQPLFMEVGCLTIGRTHRPFDSHLRLAFILCNV